MMQASQDGITVFTTGGTIDKLYFDALGEYQIGDSIAARLLAFAVAQIAAPGVYITMNGEVLIPPTPRRWWISP